MKKSIVLIGYKGVGKSYWGRLLAQKLQWPFIDTDDLFRGDLSCGELARQIGKEAFLIKESLAIASLDENTRAVIATGGGSILMKENRQKLKSTGCVIYLKAEPEWVKKRMQLLGIPSFLDVDDFEASFAKMWAERELLYETSCHYSVRVDLANPLEQIIMHYLSVGEGKIADDVHCRNDA